MEEIKVNPTNIKDRPIGVDFKGISFVMTDYVATFYLTKEQADKLAAHLNFLLQDMDITEQGIKNAYQTH